ncbi:MAG: glycoside hydrolase family 127 protein [Sedimentisphaerales bacterium]|nr:glycoside hydrolase family 127 protein [Sedimentisphaerales bacterium]
MQFSKKAIISCLFLVLSSGFGRWDAVLAGQYTVRPKIKIQAQPFDLDRIRLLDGPFRHAMEKDIDWLVRLEPDRLLSRFREYAGLEPKAPIYGGWERDTISGHSLGHYLTACSLGYAATGDQRLLEKVNYIIDELALCQDAYGDGYVAGIPNGRKVFAEVAKGDIRSKGFDLNGLWVPWYTTHKLMAGLRDAYLYCDNAKAKTILVKLADWAYAITDKLNDEQIQTMLACEHGGMNELAAEVYALTGDSKYLTLAERFYHKAILDPLSREDDPFPGVHANTQIPKLVGIARLYELTGNPRFHTIATFAWDTIIDHHTYITGGNSNREHFGPQDQLSERLSENTTETCNTYNMLKFTRPLFSWQGEARYMDYYERALLNHILASQNPDDGMTCYFVPLAQGAMKTYCSPFDSFWCCTGTGMENHVKYGQQIYSHNGDDLYVNLFIASELDWKEKGIKIRQETRFPERPFTRLIIQCQQAHAGMVYVRYPYWAQKGVTIKINGQTQQVSSKSQEYIPLKRTWVSGDSIEIHIPMTLRLETMPDNTDRIVFMYGPLVLAGEFGDRRPEPWVPVLMAQDRNPSRWIKPVPGDLIRFKTEGVGRPDDFTLIPFYRMHHQWYSVYFDLFTEQQWTQRKTKYEAEQKRLRELEARTVDFVQPGEMQPERDHNFQGETTYAGSHQNRKWRDARNGGWFSFDLKVIDDQPIDLVCTYWGDDAGNREFDLLVDGKLLATQVLNRDAPGEFFDMTYALPKELLEGKEKITLRFQAHEGKTAGGVFGCRILKRK